MMKKICITFYDMTHKVFSSNPQYSLRDKYEPTEDRKIVGGMLALCCFVLIVLALGGAYLLDHYK